MDYKTDNIRYIETYAKARAKYESRLGILNAFSGIYLQLKYNTPETFDKYSEEYEAIMENSKVQYNALVADMCRLSDRYKQIISEESNE